MTFQSHSFSRSMTTPLFEYQISTGFNWEPWEQDAVDKIGKINGKPVLELIHHYGKKEIKATQHVGIFCLGERTIEVLPKIYKKTENFRQQAIQNLFYMLGYTEQLEIHQHTLTSLLQQNLDWLEILTQLFAKNLLEEWQRGAFRSYQEVDDTLPVLKGKWNFTEQLCHPERKHLFSVTYDEFTADNQLNRVLRYVVERLWKLTRNFKNRQMLNELRGYMDEVTLLQSIDKSALKMINITRLNQRYQPLLALAKLFIDNSSLPLSTGNSDTFAFTFDMNTLFEEFVISFIDRHRLEILPIHLQNCELLPQSLGESQHLAVIEKNNTNVFMLKPDLVVRQNGSFPLILDTKYKLLKRNYDNLGVSTDDFYQMYAYAQQYKCLNVYLIYPQTADMPESLKMDFRIDGNGSLITAATIDLRGNLSDKHEQDSLIERLRKLFEHLHTV
jgi:5-methylcytosine-specific restriction enzyme subunit McrC